MFEGWSPAGDGTRPQGRRPRLRGEDAGAVAQAAGAGPLVLSHVVPGAAGLVPDERWIAKAGQTFAGDIVRGHELQVRKP